MMALPQLQRDLREVEDALELARHRWHHYLALDERELARHAGAVVLAHEQLRTTLTNRYFLLHESKS